MIRNPATEWRRWLVFLAGVWLVFPGTVLGQEEAAAPAAEEGGSVVTDYLNDGGWMMYVILIVSVIGMILFVERVIDLYLRRRLNAEGFMAQVLGAVEKGRWEEAVRHCRVSTKHPLVEVIRTGIVSANQRERDIERAVEDVMLRSLKPLTKRVGIIALLANSATLLGLLGTILGLITAFNSVAAASAAERQTALADGISQAMYTTFFGILVAVPLLFFHHFVSRRQEVIMMEVESGATAVMVTLARARKSGSMPGAGAAGDLRAV
ncbi:MAG: MotA/TolQ/ExbB proton channel family protein [Myxococcota bacterium]